MKNKKRYRKPLVCAVLLLPQRACDSAAKWAIKAVAVGRKNWMFFGSARCGEREAMLYSLLGTCKLNGVDPEAWLRQVLSVLPDKPSNRVEKLLPWSVDLTSA
ncbi:transposase domain-containing protein [Citrobacter freundii]|nr:transposase domain-containing protein [Citrobacter freundii]